MHIDRRVVNDQLYECGTPVDTTFIVDFQDDVVRLEIHTVTRGPFSLATDEEFWMTREEAIDLICALRTVVE